MAPINGIDDPFRNLPNELLSRIFVLSDDSPLHVFDFRLKVPRQYTISQVCSRWRQVALSTGALWNDVRVVKSDANSSFYTHSLRLYRMWVSRAGDYPLTITVHLAFLRANFYKVLLDFVLPFRITKLHIEVPAPHKLVDLPPLNVEEFAIVGLDLHEDEDLKASPFMEKTRHIHIFRSFKTFECELKLKQLFLSWRQLRSFESELRAVSLSTFWDASES